MIWCDSFTCKCIKVWLSSGFPLVKINKPYPNHHSNTEFFYGKHQFISIDQPQLMTMHYAMYVLKDCDATPRRAGIHILIGRVTGCRSNKQDGTVTVCNRASYIQPTTRWECNSLGTSLCIFALIESIDVAFYIISSHYRCSLCIYFSGK